MRLIGGPSEWKRPLNVGLMFFHERPDDFFPYARIEVVDKPDPTGIGMTEKIFAGPLDRQLRDALSYIKNYIIKEKVIKLPDQAEAVRIFNLPYAAVEESLSNAIYHKSYQIGEPITVTVTPDRMEITSLPGPDRTISNDDLMNRRLISRRYRNRRIGDFLKELKLVEGRNTGIPTILHAMEANGSDMPLFETDEERTYFTVILPIHKNFLMPETAVAPKKKQRRSLPDLKELVVATLTENRNLSTSELASELGYTKVTSTLSKALKELMAEGIVQYSEPEKVRSRNQKLYLVKEHGNICIESREHGILTAISLLSFHNYFLYIRMPELLVGQGKRKTRGQSSGCSFALHSPFTVASIINSSLSSSRSSIASKRLQIELFFAFSPVCICSSTDTSNIVISWRNSSMFGYCPSFSTA